jgi:hypothetical protein
MQRPFAVGPVQKGSSAMLWRHLCLVRAYSAAGLLGGMMILGGSAATAQSQAPAPAPAASRPEPSAPPASVATETVDLLEAGKSGDLTVVAHGQGQDKVKMTIRNTTKRRLNVIVPPGLVAASKVAQAGAGGGGRLQSIGLGSVSNREGAFGDFQADAPAAGLRSIPATGEGRARSVAVPAGESINVTITGVCLNYGLPAPTGRDTLTVMDVDTYTTDPRIRKALRSLSTLGTSHGVAQAVMWHLCNELPFELMLEQSGKIMNPSEIALAARFVQAIDESTAPDRLEGSALTESRILVQVEGQGALAREAQRLNVKLAGLRVLGLPIKVVEGETLPPCSAPALGIRVILTDSKVAETRGRIVVSTLGQGSTWSALGHVAFRENSSVSVIDGETLARVIDRAVSGAFVSVKPARKAVGSTTLKVENRLPFTVSNLVVRAGNSAGAPSVPFEAVGVGPARSALLPIQAASASLVEHVELNGL